MEFSVNELKLLIGGLCRTKGYAGAEADLVYKLEKQLAKQEQQTDETLRQVIQGHYYDGRDVKP